MNVLSVDDDPIQSNIIRAWLEPMGFRVFIADSVPQGMELLSQHDIALCMVDWHISPWDGSTLIAAMRACPHFRHIPILAVSADNRGPVITAAADLRVDAYLLKPLQRSVLAKHLLRLGLVQAIKSAPPPPGLANDVAGRESLRIATSSEIAFN